MINLFVSRLDYGVTQDDLTTLFKPYGTVRKVSVVMDRETGRSKGFAFIEIDGDDAQKIIDELDGYSLKDRSISVKIAEDRSSRPPGNRPNQTERKPYSDNRPARPETSSSTPFREDDDSKSDFSSNPAIDLNSKTDRSKKSKVAGKKGGAPINLNDGPKKGKMQAYKKSGKNNRFFYDDEDDY